MYCGKIVESGAGPRRDRRGAHPYTVGPVNSIPDLGTDKKRLDTIPGIVPNMFDLPQGCYFSPRCAYARDICRREQPALREVAPGHCAACHFPLNREAR